MSFIFIDDQRTAANWINASALQTACAARHRSSLPAGNQHPSDKVRIELVTTTGSTNTDLLQQLRHQPFVHQAIVRIAEEQTAGRGRQGRAWQSYRCGASLTFSVALPWFDSLSQLSGASLAAGLAVVRAIEAALPKPARSKSPRMTLKWPNDVLLDGNKVAGILMETCPLDTSSTLCVVGIGINLVTPNLAEAHDHPSALPAIGLDAIDNICPETLLADLITELLSLWETLQTQGFPVLQDEWNNHHYFQHQPVVIYQAGQMLHRGHCLGVNQQGALIVQENDQCFHVVSGDIASDSHPFSLRVDHGD